MGNTSVTLKPYLYPSGLEDFDEDAPLPVRKRWWERFVHLAVQCSCGNRTKLYEFKLKVSPAVRDWRGQLPKHERRDWIRFSKRFEREYCRLKVSDTESYYTMTQDKDEKALAFLHRLNIAAERTGVDFRKYSRRRQQHKVADLEYLLKQRELCREDDSPIRAPQSRDIQAGNVVRDRFDPKCQARVHVVQRETVFREVTPGARAMARTQAMNVGEDYFPL
ncbi:hypothetical protein PR001_g16680 [Phytophthora rubi]|uniref:Retrotransposon gag domain-containing protein n=1 Tax=Phytophthora rubi TaxID=129364 RepID=A0A6A3KT94_9STRA|nr:hypothetical protein PR001_g16680 [Phytophthora rubi]